MTDTDDAHSDPLQGVAMHGEQNDIEIMRSRLLRLEAFESARQLLYAYAAATDERILESVLALFAPEAVLHSPRGVYSGRAQIAQSYATGWVLEPSRKRHFITNAQLTVQDNGAVAATAYFLYVGRDTERSVIGWGTYDDLIDVSGDRPLFLAKKITLMVSTDLDTGWPLEGEDA